jgi:hypothetical protein
MFVLGQSVEHEMLEFEVDFSRLTTLSHPAYTLVHYQTALQGRLVAITMPIWNNQRKARQRASITAESLNASMDGGFWGDDLEDLLSSDFTPLIARSSDDHAAEDENVSEPASAGQPPKSKEGGGRMRRSSLVKAMGFRPGGRNNDDHTDASIMSPLGKRAPAQKTFSLPRTSRFSISRKLSSKVDGTSGSITSPKPSSSPTKKKRSYLTKRSQLPEVKERKEDVALSLQKYLDAEPEEEKKSSDREKQEEERSVTLSVSKSPKIKTSSSSSSRHKSSKNSSSSREKGSSSVSPIDEMKSPRKSSKSSHSRDDKDPKKEKKEKKRSTKSSSKSSSSSSSAAPTTPRAAPTSDKTPKSAGTHLDLTGMNTTLSKPIDDMKASQRSESTERTEGTESTFSYPPPIEELF